MMKKLIVASNSPRRQELMSQAGFEFEVFTTEIDENVPKKLPAFEVATYLAELKNNEYRKLLRDEIILTSDTVVIAEGTALGKPKNKDEAYRMLKMLSNTVHEVVSGVCISSLDKRVPFDDKTLVYFKELSESEIDYYIDKYEPFDKAGAYGIQEWIGMIGVDKIEGSFYNVMGLPIHKVYDCLIKEFSMSVSKQH